MSVPAIRSTFLRSCIWAVLPLVCGLAPATASTVRTLDLPEMTKKADTIADVTVQKLESFWTSPAGSRAIHTRVTFSVNQSIKGRTSQTLTLEFHGGELPDRGLKVAGMPNFKVGERYVIFATDSIQPQISPVLGMQQGALRVVHDNESKADRVFRYWGQPVSQKESFMSRNPALTGATSREYLRSADTIDTFAARVRALNNP